MSTSHNINPTLNPRHIPNSRPTRIQTRRNEDSFALASYGQSIHVPKSEAAMRVFFQNIKGLTHSTNNEDYRYVMHQFIEMKVDICGMAETNTAWQHPYLRHEFNSAITASGMRLSKANFASPSREIDTVPTTEFSRPGDP